jgi:alkylation response protein AidB-like acyl-CoA dehydrogenase
MAHVNEQSATPATTATATPVTEQSGAPVTEQARARVTDEPATGGMHVTEQQARQVAEAAREPGWTRPSFAKELYLGRFDLGLIHPWPRPEPDVAARGAEFLDRLVGYCRTLDGQRIERDARIPDEYVTGLAALGAFGMKIPVAYGGLGLSMADYGRALMLLGSVHPSIGALLSAHQSIGVPEPVKLVGTEQQKRAYLPRCAAGAVSAFLLTEPDVGSDPARLAATATPVEDGRAYLLDGVKLWTTNGVIAELLVVMARVPSGDGHSGGITAFVVEADSAGIIVERRNEFMGLRGIENGVTRFHRVRVPAENRLGREGEGLRIALTTLNTGRLSLPAMGAGAGKWCLKIAREWSAERVQWGRPVGRHEAVAGKIGFIAATTFALESVFELSAALADAGSKDIRIEAALAKLWSSEMAWRIADELVQIRGGRGYETAESLAARGERAVAAEQLLRDLRINRIFEGSTEIMHLLIAREAVDAHLQAAGDLAVADAPVSAKLRAAAGASGFYARWLPTLAAGRGDVPWSYGEFGALAGHLRFVERASRRLARNSFYGMARWQAGLEHRQAFLARVVDIGAELFAMAASCVRATMPAEDRESGEAARGDGAGGDSVGVGGGGDAASTGAGGGDGASAASATDLADAFCAQSRLRVQQLFRSLWSNTDAGDTELAHRVLDGRYHWLEHGVLDISEGTGPWIASSDPGPSRVPNVHRRYR